MITLDSKTGAQIIFLPLSRSSIFTIMCRQQPEAENRIIKGNTWEEGCPLLFTSSTALILPSKQRNRQSNWNNFFQSNFCRQLHFFCCCFFFVQQNYAPLDPLCCICSCTGNLAKLFSVFPFTSFPFSISSVANAFHLLLIEVLKRVVPLTYPPLKSTTIDQNNCVLLGLLVLSLIRSPGLLNLFSSFSSRPL